MIDTIIIFIFVIGYLAIALEHKIGINKTATALLIGVSCWVLVAAKGCYEGNIDCGTAETLQSLGEHFQNTAQLLVFLMGAMAIVQLMDSHNGFKVITDCIKTSNKRKLLWVISFITFFLSSVLDNLTTTIVMVSSLRRLMDKGDDRMIFASMIIIAANAGGAWTPIGDVTTTMLWIGGRITTARIMTALFIPSIVSLVIPLLYFSFLMKKEIVSVPIQQESQVEVYGTKRIFFLGLGSLIFVPIFRAITNMPPFMGMILGLGVMWVLTDLMHRQREHLRVPHILSKIDFTSILFFLGILLAVAALETVGILKNLALGMDQYFRNKDVIITIMGLLSAIIDNVPLTAAAMGMYDLSLYPVDSKLWEFIAYAVGTGGSILIIGSAAGVVAMGMEKINFTWYLRKISLPAFIGYFAGIFSYLAIYQIMP